MAGIDVGGGHGGKRSTNHEIPLIPFIDFLLCLVAFLLVTAVWSQMARINEHYVRTWTLRHDLRYLLLTLRGASLSEAEAMS